MDPTLHSKHKLHQEHCGEHGECEGWLEWQDGWSVADEAAGNNLQVAKQGGGTDHDQEQEEEPCPEPAKADIRQGGLYKSDSSQPKPLSSGGYEGRVCKVDGV